MTNRLNIFKGLSNRKWHLFVDLFPPVPVERGRGMPHMIFCKALNILSYGLIHWLSLM
jgi:hypothetical protein